MGSRKKDEVCKERDFRDIMRRFSRRNSKKNIKIEYYDYEWPYLYIETPILLARYVAHVKKKNKDKGCGWVYLRGQVENFESMRPSLFRGDNSNVKVGTLLKAQKELANKIKINFDDYARFKVKDLPALLQHYGIRTSWLDVLDNLFVAIWFGSHKIEKITRESGEFIIGDLIQENQETLNGRNEKYGWIYLISQYDMKAEKRLKIKDLRSEFHDLSIRPHTQHGYSVTFSNEKTFKNGNTDLKDFVISTVKFPSNQNWKLFYTGFSYEYMFPSTFHDNTLQYLKDGKTNRYGKRAKRVDEIIIEVERKYKLPPGSLGRVTWLSSKRITESK